MSEKDVFDFIIKKESRIFILAKIFISQELNFHNLR
jgi:hypothetical protein